jgi:uncharacterized protein (TIGR03067 family)
MSGRLLLMLSLSFAVGFAPAPLPRRAAPEGGDAKRLQGEWVVVEQHYAGRPRPAQPGDLTRLTVVGDRWTFYANGDARSRWAVKLDPHASPRTADLMSVNGGQVLVPAIYRLEGGRLSFCYSGSRRPTSFDTQDGSWLLVFRRR